MCPEIVLSDAVRIIPQEPNAAVSAPAFEARVHEVDPLTDPRWREFVGRHPRSSVFHSIPWLRALQQTYGYTPIVLTTSIPDEPLTNGALFCEVDSWLTGRRLVSLPFSDYCEILCSERKDRNRIFRRLDEEIREKRWRYVEIRPVEREPSFGSPVVSYTLHRVDLTPDLATLFANLHHSSIQRKIARAEREHLAYLEGSGEGLLDTFYPLLALTRRRHRVPPQPRSWFRTLLRNFGENLKIRLALKDSIAVAGIITIRHKDTLYYKYGGSDARFHRFGGMHLLYWKAIEDAKRSGLKVFDLGRSDLDQPGLITFKSRWGSTVSDLSYVRKSPSEPVTHLFESSGSGYRTRLARTVFAHAPISVLSALGELLYRHVG